MRMSTDVPHKRLTAEWWDSITAQHVAAEASMRRSIRQLQVSGVVLKIVVGVQTLIVIGMIIERIWPGPR